MMFPSCHLKRSLYKVAAMSVLVTPSSAFAQTNLCSAWFPFGLVELPPSQSELAIYGADIPLLYGDWDWADFGIDTTTPRHHQYVYQIAALAETCFSDPVYGRLHSQFYAKGIEETDQEFFERIFDKLVDLKRSLLIVQNNYEALLAQHAPLATADPSMFQTVSDTLLGFYAKTAHRTLGIGWVIEQIQWLDNALRAFVRANQLTRTLIEQYVRTNPEIRNIIIDRLRNNTNGVLDTYGEYFSEERRQVLEELLIEAEAVHPEDVEELIRHLTTVAESIESNITDIWSKGTPVFLIGIKLRFIYGGCGENPPTLVEDPEYFGGFAVSSTIAALAPEPSYCEGL